MAEIFKRLWNRVYMFQLSCISLLFVNVSSFKPDIENNANLDAVSSKRRRGNMTRCNFS